MGKKATPKIIRSTAPNQIDRIKENFLTLGQRAIADIVQSKIEDVLAGKIAVVDCIEDLTVRQLEANEENRVDSNIKQAHFPWQGKTLATYDFSIPKRINKEQIMYLATCNFIEEGRNVLIFGPSRVGKTHIAVGIGREAINQGHPTLFVDLTDLIVQLMRKEMSEREQETLLKKLQNKKLLILDEIREQEVSSNARTFLFRLVKHRNEKRMPIIFTSMQGLEQWKTIFHTDRDSVINRIRERSIEVVIDGEPWLI